MDENVYTNSTAKRIEKIFELKRDLSSIGLAIIGSIIIMEILLILFSNIEAKFDMFSRFKGHNDIIYNCTKNNIISIIAMVLPFSSLLKNEKNNRDIIKFDKVKPKMLLAFVALGVFTSVCANFMSTMLKFNLNKIGICYDSPSFPVGQNPIEMIFSIAAVAVVPAIVEEFAFRGVVLGKLRKYGDHFAVLVSSALFGLIHLNLVQVPFAFVLGLILGILVVETNSMLPSILIHFTNNLWAISINIIEKFKDQQISEVYCYLSFLVFISSGTLGLIYILKKKPDFLSNNSSGSCLFFKKDYIKSFRNIGMIMLLLLSILYFFQKIEIRL
jgi:membrane protease YdiL (CAAX protease family)